jgi:YegS/Rv2252/BmrU family lipid kinase
MGVLPGGRGNDFVRMLGLSRKPVEACAALASPREQAVDLGMVGGHPFVGIASCGFDSDANRIANETQLVKGNLVYAYGLLRAIASWKPATFTLELDDGSQRTARGYSIAAANSRYFGGGMMLAPSASLQDGQLEVVIIKQVSRLQYLLLSPSVFWGGHVRLPYVEILRSARLTISASRPFTVYADGDPIAELPATVTVQPEAIRVLVPSQ